MGIYMKSFVHFFLTLYYMMNSAGYKAEYSANQLQYGLNNLFDMRYGIIEQEERIDIDRKGGGNSLGHLYENAGLSFFLKVQTDETQDHIGFEAAVSYALQETSYRDHFLKCYSALPLVFKSSTVAINVAGNKLAYQKDCHEYLDKYDSGVTDGRCLILEGLEHAIKFKDWLAEYKHKKGELLTDLLKALLDLSAETLFSHNDFHAGNIMYDKNRSKLVVIDYGRSYINMNHILKNKLHDLIMNVFKENTKSCNDKTETSWGGWTSSINTAVHKCITNTVDKSKLLENPTELLNIVHMNYRIDRKTSKDIRLPVLFDIATLCLNIATLEDFSEVFALSTYGATVPCDVDVIFDFLHNVASTETDKFKRCMALGVCWASICLHAHAFYQVNLQKLHNAGIQRKYNNKIRLFIPIDMLRMILHIDGNRVFYAPAITTVKHHISEAVYKLEKLYGGLSLPLFFKSEFSEPKSKKMRIGGRKHHHNKLTKMENDKAVPHHVIDNVANFWKNIPPMPKSLAKLAHNGGGLTKPKKTNEIVNILGRRRCVYVQGSKKYVIVKGNLTLLSDIKP